MNIFRSNKSKKEARKQGMLSHVTPFTTSSNDYSDGHPGLKNFPALVSNDEILLSTFDRVERKNVYPCGFCVTGKSTTPTEYVIGKETVTITNRRITVVSHKDPSNFVLRILKELGGSKEAYVLTSTEFSTYLINNVVGMSSSEKTVVHHQWGSTCCSCSGCWKICCTCRCPGCPALCMPVRVEDIVEGGRDTITLHIQGANEAVVMEVPFEKSMQIRADIMHASGRGGAQPAEPAIQVMIDEPETTTDMIDSKFGKKVTSTIVPREHH